MKDISRKDGFLLKRWEVTVSGYPHPGFYPAATRGRALAEAWACDAFNAITFGDFLKIARCRRSVDAGQFGDAITVDGKPAFFVTQNNQYVEFAWPDDAATRYAHPSEVLPECYRPPAYRSTSASSSKGQP